MTRTPLRLQPGAVLRCRQVRDVRDAVRAARGASGDPRLGAPSTREFLDLCGRHPGAAAFLAPTMVQRLVQTGPAVSGNLHFW